MTGADEAFVVVANRLPVDEVQTETGREWRRSPGGLVTAPPPVPAHQPKRGLLGADLVGFQTPLGAQNFLRLAHHLLGLRRRGSSVEIDGRVVRAGSFPVSIDIEEMESIVAAPGVRERAKEIREELGQPKTL